MSTVRELQNALNDICRRLDDSANMLSEYKKRADELASETNAVMRQTTRVDVQQAAGQALQASSENIKEAYQALHAVSQLLSTYVSEL